ncbi:hypothetical protein BGX31_008921 [Mortierella sp. GBA43]|nr:hypothetical protein BGX31_008921 [Mortierella sp. GBA43]
MSKKLAAQALDALLNNQSAGGISKRRPATGATGSATPVTKKSKSLPATKTGLKKIKHELRYGHSIKRAQEAAAAKENPLVKLKLQMEKEQSIVERNLSYYKITSRASKKELDLRKKIKLLRAKAQGIASNQGGKAIMDQESDGEA